MNRYCLLFGGLALLLIGCAPPQSGADETNELGAIVEKRYAANEPGAAVLVLQGDQVVLNRGYGLANLEWAIPVTKDTVIGLGSVTKQFTSVAVLNLVQAGKVDLDNHLSDYIVNLPEQFGRATVRQVLSHTGGYPDLFGNREWFSLTSQPMTPAAIIDLMADMHLIGEPGHQYAYSNFGYMVLARLIEEVSGKSFIQYMEEDVLTPLDMTSSFLDEFTRVIPNRATGYVGNGQLYTQAGYFDMSHVVAAGAMMTSLVDMAKWHRGLLSGKLINKELLAEAWTKTSLNDQTEVAYGLGWKIGSLLGHPIIFHDGSSNGYNATTIYAPDENIFIAYLSNSQTGPNTTSMSRRLFASAVGSPVPEFTPAGEGSYSTVGLSGEYRMDDEATAHIRVVGDLMQIKMGHGGWHEFLAADGDVFYRPGTLSYFTMVRDSAGDIQGLDYVANDLTKVSGAKVSDDVDMGPTPVPFDPDIMAALVGVYDVGAGALIKVEFADGKMAITLGPEAPIEMLSSGPDSYFSLRHGTTASFIISEGSLPELSVVRGGFETRAKKITQ